jgi:RND superfamily putative drug exporter
MRRFGLQSIARACARHPWRTIAAWAIVLVGAGLLSAFYLGSALSNEVRFTNNPESQRADALVRASFPGSDKPQEFVILRSPTLTVDDPAFRRQAAALTAGVLTLGPEVVESAVDYTTTPLPALISTDRHAAVAVFTMAGDLKAADSNAEALVARAKAVGETIGDGTGSAADTAVPGDFSVLVAGNGSINHDFSTLAEKDLRTGELFGAGIALVILVIVFGALVTAILPLVLALCSIVLALGATSLVGQAMDLSLFITNMITMIGLAMGIDYSLFVVSRYREERVAGHDKIAAIARAASTASRSVLFSAIAVILALGGLFLVPSTLFHSMAVGAILAVFASLLAALTLLPALLGLLGDRVNALRVPFIRRAMVPTPGGAAAAASGAAAAAASGRAGSGHNARTGSGAARRGFWDRLSYGVMRRPIFSLVAAVAVLGLAASLYFSISLGSAGVASLPPDSQSRQAFELLLSDFPSEGLTSAQIAIVADAASPAVAAGIERLEAQLATNPGFGLPVRVEPSPAGNLTLVSVPVVGDATGKAAEDAVRALRADYIPAVFAGTGLTGGVDILVTGQTAGTIDYLDSIKGATPWVFLFVLALSFVLLLVVFRSLLVPLKAILMNLLSVGAAYGLMVAVFQKGWGADLLGLQKVDFVEAWVPLFLFAILFGTSMDYHVFLLSRIRERFDQTGDNRESVAFGLRRTGGIITGAALIMVAVFGGFAAGQLVMFQQLGFGLAVAVFLDATIVRSVLVPAAMRLLGVANWWFPQALRWLPDLRVESGEAPAGSTAGSRTAAPTAVAALATSSALHLGADEPLSDEV